ncbi:MAG: alpha/beta hydrolase, partial [Caulobacteraceae bacterium]
ERAALRARPDAEICQVTACETRIDVVCGHPVSTFEVGAGPTLLFLHGAGGISDSFPGGAPSPFMAELAKSFRVLAPEHPGFGATERPPWLGDIHDLAYFYLDYIAARGLSHVHLAGHSMGGWIAMEIAVRNTSALASLTLAAAAGIKVKGALSGDLFLWNREQLAENLFANPANSRAFLAHQPNPEQLRALLRNMETAALLGWSPRFHNPALAKWLHRIDKPTHVIWPDQDKVFPLAYGEALRDLIPGARLSVIEAAGHVLDVDQPKAFSDAIAGFILGDAA